MNLPKYWLKLTVRATVRSGTTVLFSILGVAGLSCAAHRPVETAKAPIGIPLRGTVVYPDGTAAAGATVTAESNCPDSRVRLLDEAEAASDGSFAIPSFDPTCAKIRFTASHPSKYWLRTGEAAFCLAPSGTSPEIEVTNTSIDPVTVNLGEQGGELELRVFDSSSDRFVYGSLYIQQLCGAGHSYTSVGAATGEDGSPHILLVPAGRYRVQLEQFRCSGAVFFAATPPAFEFDVIATRRTSALLRLDLSQIATRSSYANVEARKCSR